jgi:hypothetical protein
MADLAGSAGTSLESMKALIEQNKNVLQRCEIIQRQTQNLCTSMSMQNFFSLILQCDVDNSGCFDQAGKSLPIFVPQFRYTNPTSHTPQQSSSSSPKG